MYVSPAITLVSLLLALLLAAAADESVWELDWFKDKNVFPLSAAEARDKLAATGMCTFTIVQGPNSGFAQPTFIHTRMEPRGLDASGLEKFKGTCPGHAGVTKFDGEWQKLVCCSLEMQDRATEVFAFMDAVLKNCPVCAYNARAIICNSICNPHQGGSVRGDVDEKTHPKGTRELVQAKEFQALYRHEDCVVAHGSCKDVKPSGGEYPAPYGGYSGPKLGGNTADLGSGGDKLSSGLAKGSGQSGMTIACRGYGMTCDSCKDANGTTWNAWGTTFHIHLDYNGKWTLPADHKGRELGEDLFVNTAAELVHCDQKSPNGDAACPKDQCGPKPN